MRRGAALLLAACGVALAAACANDYDGLGPPPETELYLYPDEMVLAPGDSLTVRAAYGGHRVTIESRDTAVARLRLINPPEAPTRLGWVHAGVPGTTWLVVSVVEAPGRSDSLRVHVTP